MKAERKPANRQILSQYLTVYARIDLLVPKNYRPTMGTDKKTYREHHLLTTLNSLQASTYWWASTGAFRTCLGVLEDCGCYLILPYPKEGTFHAKLGGLRFLRIDHAGQGMYWDVYHYAQKAAQLHLTKDFAAHVEKLKPDSRSWMKIGEIERNVKALFALHNEALKAKGSPTVTPFTYVVDEDDRPF
jgi:hypothetical protein